VSDGVDAVLRSGPLAFVDDLDDPVLDDTDLHHFTRVLRVRPGAALCVSDGHGRWRTATLAERPDNLGPLHHVERRSPEVTIAVAMAKGSRTDLVVQKLTELGVDRIVLLHAARSVVRWDATEAPRRLDRLGRVLREAAMQSRQVWLPTLVGPVAPGEVAGIVGGPVAWAEPGGRPPSVTVPTVLIGPEGGWTPEELAAATHTVGLGGSVLRVETAAIAAGALLCAQRDAWGGSGPV
jgi:16S rRNA (uracil1498-N3)-methyltransferase